VPWAHPRCDVKALCSVEQGAIFVSDIVFRKVAMTMGSVASMDRANRFIKEFASDIIPTLSLKVGTTLVVTSVGISDDGCGSIVGFALLADEESTRCVEVELVDDGVFFDVDYSFQEDVIADIADRLRKTEEEVRDRLKRVDLLREGV
jgi:hypothetical protein